MEYQQQRLLEYVELLAPLAETLPPDTLPSLLPAIAQARHDVGHLGRWTVGVIGSAGCGKSTWINALCGLNNLLPSKYGSKSVTTCPTVIRAGPVHRCTFRLASPEQLRTLLADTAEDREWAELHQALTLLYEDDDECGDLFSLREWTNEAGVMSFECSGPEEVSSYLQYFILPRSMAPPPRHFQNDAANRRFWPIIQEIIVEIADGRLPWNVQIVDTPGLGDVTMHRFPMTRRWLAQCHEMWLLSETRFGRMQELLEANVALLRDVPRVHLLMTKAEGILPRRGEHATPDAEEERQDVETQLMDIIQKTELRAKDPPIDVRFTGHFDEAPTLPDDLNTLRDRSDEVDELHHSLIERLEEIYKSIRKGLSKEELARSRHLVKSVFDWNHQIQGLLRLPAEREKFDEWSLKLSQLNFRTRRIICDARGGRVRSSAPLSRLSPVFSFVENREIDFRLEFVFRFIEPLEEKLRAMVAELLKDIQGYDYYPRLKRAFFALFRTITSHIDQWIADAICWDNQFHRVDQLVTIYQVVLEQIRSRVDECLRRTLVQAKEIQQRIRNPDLEHLPSCFWDIDIHLAFSVWGVRCHRLLDPEDPYYDDLSRPLGARDALLGVDPSLRPLFEADFADELSGNLSAIAKVVKSGVSVVLHYMIEDMCTAAWMLQDEKSSGSSTDALPLMIKPEDCSDIEMMATNKFHYGI